MTKDCRWWCFVPGWRAFVLLVLAGVAIACGSGGGLADDDDDGPNPEDVEIALGMVGDRLDSDVDGAGNLHLVYRRASAPGVFYRVRAANGTWGDERQLPDSHDVNTTHHAFNDPRVSAAPDGTVHFVWGPQSYDRNGIYYARWDGGGWNPGRVQLTDTWVEAVEIEVTDGGTVHVFGCHLNWHEPSGAISWGTAVVDYSFHSGSPPGGLMYGRVVSYAEEVKEPNATSLGEDVHLVTRFIWTAYHKYSGGNWWTVTRFPDPVNDSMGDPAMFAANGHNPMLMFVSWKYGPEDVYAMTFDGANFVNLVAISSPDSSWSPTGASIVGNRGSGERIAVWSDYRGYLRYAAYRPHDGSNWSWSADTQFVPTLTQLNPAETSSPTAGFLPGSVVAVWTHRSSGEIYEASLSWPPGQ